MTYNNIVWITSLRLYKNNLPSTEYLFECFNIFRSIRPEVFCKKDLRNFAKFTGKLLCLSLFFHKVPGLKQSENLLFDAQETDRFFKSALILKSLASQIGWAPNGRLFAKIRVPILLISKPYLSRCSCSFNVFLFVFTMIYSVLHKISFKLRVHMTIFWNLAHFHFPGIPIRKNWEYRGVSTVLEWPPKFFGRVLGPLPEHPKMVSRCKIFCGTLLQSLA